MSHRWLLNMAAAIATISLLAACDDEGDSHHPTSYVNEGSLGVPHDITGLLPYAGQVAVGGTSYYRAGGLTPTAVHTITLARSDGLPYQSVPDASTAGSIACGSTNTVPGAIIACAMLASAEGAAEFSVHGDEEIGGAFTVMIEPGGIVNEGSPDDPVVVDTFPFSGGALNVSYYRLQGFAPGAAQSIEFVEASGPVALSIFPDSSYQSQPSLCSSRFAADPPCNVIADGAGHIHLLTSAQEEGHAVSYTIAAAGAAVADEGSAAAPIDITDRLPYSGMVHLGSSWYIIAGLPTLTSQTVILSDASDDVVLYLYGPGWTVPGGPRADCTCAWANGGGDPIVCVASTDDQGEVRIEVRGFDTVAGAVYALDSMPGGIPNEGNFGAPIDVTGATPWAGTVFNGPSYYRVTGLAGATDYTVTLGQLTADLALWIYDDAGYANLLGTSNQPGTADESCVVQTTTGELHVRVTVSTGPFGATFSLDVAP